MSVSQQLTYDTIVSHLRQQDCKSVTPNGRICLYRGPEKRKCAAGCLISDEVYQHEFEGSEVNEFNEIGNIIKSNGHDLRLVRDLQSVHDKIPVYRWEEHFEQVARTYDLVYKF